MRDTCDRNGFVTSEGAKAIINKAIIANPTRDNGALARLQFLELQMNAVRPLRLFARELADAIETWQNSTSRLNDPENEEMGLTFNPDTDKDFISALQNIVREL